MLRTLKTLSVMLCLGTLAIGCDSDDDDGGMDAGADTEDESAGATTEDGAGSTTDDGGDATEAMASCQTDICATYGAAVPAVSEAIVMQAAADPMFMDDFAGLVAAGDDAVAAFIDSLANFISDAYGCTDGAYTGPSMVDAHTGLNITQEEYDAFIGLIAGVLADAGVPEADINQCFAPPLVDPTFTATIVGL